MDILTNDESLITIININQDLKDYLLIKKYETIKKINFHKFQGIILEDDKNLVIGKSKLKEEFEKQEIEFTTILEWSEKFNHRIPVELINPQFEENLIARFRKNKFGFNFLLKRIFELIFSIFLLFLSLPLILVASILIYLEDKGPIFYSQSRVGRNGREFTIWKLRSMKVNARKMV